MPKVFTNKNKNRKRVCLNCSHKFTTLEVRIEDITSDIADNLEDLRTEEMAFKDRFPNVNRYINSCRDLTIGEINLNTRAWTCMRKSQIYKVSNLLIYSEKDLLIIPSLGKHTLKSIIEILERLDVSYMKLNKNK